MIFSELRGAIKTSWSSYFFFFSGSDCDVMPLFSSPGQSPGRAIVLPPVLASALAKCYSFALKFVM